MANKPTISQAGRIWIDNFDDGKDEIAFGLALKFDSAEALRAAITSLSVEFEWPKSESTEGR